MAEPSIAEQNALTAALGISNPEGDRVHKIRFLQLLQCVPRTVRKAAPGATGAAAYQAATVNAIALPDMLKAGALSRVTVRAGGVTGEFTLVKAGVTPATGEAGIAPNGDIAFLAADAVTEAEVHYEPEPVDVVEITATSGATYEIPAGYTARGVVLLMEAEGLLGSVGKKTVLLPGTVGAAGTARLNAARTQILFGDAGVTKIRVKLGIAPQVP